jgi:hypothetical protein
MSVVIAIVLILAYVIGYILRLSTPDELDKRSTEIVLKDMERAGQGSVMKDRWPIRLDDEGNKFPYFHFREYLDHRKHHDLAACVKWDEKVRSKTFVNKMKLETLVRSPQLSAIIESNEAHIRLLFGTWSACRVCLLFVAGGVVVSILGYVLPLLRQDSSPGTMFSHLSYEIWVCITVLLLLGTIAAKRQIEKLFHYRRVRELFDVVACYQLACEGFDASGRPKGTPGIVLNDQSVDRGNDDEMPIGES